MFGIKTGKPRFISGGMFDYFFITKKGFQFLKGKKGAHFDACFGTSTLKNDLFFQGNSRVNLHGVDCVPYTFDWVGIVFNRGPYDTKIIPVLKGLIKIRSITDANTGIRIPNSATKVIQYRYVCRK